jgi:hypothetical protein
VPSRAERLRGSGALDGLIAEVIEDHTRDHVIGVQASTDDPRTQAAEELVEIVLLLSNHRETSHPYSHAETWQRFPASSR